ERLAFRCCFATQELPHATRRRADGRRKSIAQCIVIGFESPQLVNLTEAFDANCYIAHGEPITKKKMTLRTSLAKPKLPHAFQNSRSVQLVGDQPIGLWGYRHRRD